MGSWVTQVVESMGYLGIALLMALENLFPPVPSELIMPLAGYVAAQGQLSLWLVVVVGTLGTVIGTLPWYAVARWVDKTRVYGWIDRHGHWLTLERRELERAEKWFRRHGRLVIAVGRVVPGVRTLISIPAGFCGMPLWQYLLYTTGGTLVWTGLLAALGQALGENYEQVSTYLDPVTWVLLGLVLVAYVTRLVRSRRRNHSRRRAQGTVR